jgi:small subunit ribosomal protein S6
MRNYEVVLIIHPDLDETAFNAAVDKVKGWRSLQVAVLSPKWMFGENAVWHTQIRKQREGQYVLINAEFAPAFTADLERNLRFLEPVIRFMITVVE